MSIAFARLPAVNVTGAIACSTTGARFGAGLTMTVKLRVAVNPLASCTMIITVAVPAVTGLMVRVISDTFTFATRVWVETAE